MDSDVIRSVGKAGIQRAAESLGGIGRKTGNKIHIHMGEAHRRCQFHGPFNVGGAVTATDSLEHLVGQGLGVDADAVHAVIQEHLQLVPVNGVGTARLNAVLHHIPEVEVLAQMGQQTIHLLCRQRGGRAAAHVERADMEPRVLHHPACRRNFRHQRLQIGFHQLKGLLHRLGDEGAVGAAGGTEGDAHIEGDVVGGQFRLGFCSRLSRLHAEAGTLGGDEIGLLQRALCLRRALAALHQAGGKLAGTHTGQAAPHRDTAQHRHRRFEKAHLQSPLTQTFLLILRQFLG